MGFTIFLDYTDHKQNDNTQRKCALKRVIPDENQIIILNNVIILRDSKNNINKSKFLSLHTSPLGANSSQSSINTWMISGITKPC